MRTNRAARAALGLAVIVLAAACGSSGGAAGGGPSAAAAAAGQTAGGSGSGTPAAGAPGATAPASAAPAGTASAAPAPPARALGRDQLTAALPTAGEAAGFTVMPIPAEPGSSRLPTRPADCQPVENVRTGKIDPKAPAFASALVMPADPSQQSGSATIQLHGHDTDGARAVLAALRTALTGCTRYEGSIPKPGTVAAQPAPSFGDEAVSYTLTSDGATEEYVVVRVGGTVAVFATGKGMGGKAARQGTANRVPQQLVTLQVDKLRKAH